MTPTVDEIEKLLYSIPGHNDFMAFLAPQEIERLAAIIYETLGIVSLQNLAVAGDYNTWSNRAGQSLITELKDSKEFFCIKDLGDWLNISELLKKIYETSYANRS